MNESTSIEGVRLTLTDVAKGVGTTPQNLHKTYIKKGKLKVKRDDLDKPYIDLVDVLQLFGDRFRLPAKGTPVDTVENLQVDDGLTSNQTVLTETLRKIAELEAKTAQAEREKADLREQLHQSQQREERLWGQVEKLTDTLKLLKGPEAPQEAPKQATTDEKIPRWISRLFGR